MISLLKRLPREQGLGERTASTRVSAFAGCLTCPARPLRATITPLLSRATGRTVFQKVFEMNYSEDQLRIIIDTIPTMAWSCCSDGSAEFFNRRWLDYTGLSAEEALGWGWEVAICPDDLPRILEIFHGGVNSAQPFEIEWRFRRLDGEFRWFLFRGNPLLDESEKVLKWYITNTDVEDRRRAEDALRASEESVRLTINSIPGFASTLSASGNLEIANQPFLDYTGNSIEELRVNHNILHPDDYERVMGLWRNSLQTERAIRFRCCTMAYRLSKQSRILFRKHRNTTAILAQSRLIPNFLCGQFRARHCTRNFANRQPTHRRSLPS